MRAAVITFVIINNFITTTTVSTMWEFLIQAESGVKFKVKKNLLI